MWKISVEPNKPQMTKYHCMLDNKGCKHTLRICNTYCFSTARMVMRTRLSVTLYVHCLSYFVCKQLHQFLYPKCWSPAVPYHCFGKLLPPSRRSINTAAGSRSLCSVGAQVWEYTVSYFSILLLIMAHFYSHLGYIGLQFRNVVQFLSTISL
jgi:hypothetical protein